MESLGHYSNQAGPESHQQVGAQPGRPAMLLALETDDPGGYGGHQQLDEDRQLQAAVKGIGEEHQVTFQRLSTQRR